ncbi:MAG: pilus assembly protein TadE [Dehalococcoidia bacterium]|nr:MAG: pilus assembly protein TadE [Dehalococcoidia bacterium]
MTARRPPAPLRALAADQSGSALVESALVIPVLLLLVVGVVMAGRVAHAQIAVQAVAREAGRTAALAPSAAQGLADAETRSLTAASGYRLALERLDVTIDPGGFVRGGTVRTAASYTVPLGDLPLLGTISVTVSSSHQQRIDVYRSRTAAAP